MPHLKLLPDARGKMHQVMVPSRRTGGRGHKKHHRFHRRLGFFSKSWVKLALVLVIAEALAVTVLAGIPKWISPQALVLWLYAAWKKNKQAAAIATILQAARLASSMGLTASVANAAAGIKLSGLSGGGAIGSGDGSGGGGGGGDILSSLGLGGGTQQDLVSNVLSGIGAQTGADMSGGSSAPGGQSVDDQGNPVPADQGVA